MRSYPVNLPRLPVNATVGLSISHRLGVTREEAGASQQQALYVPESRRIGPDVSGTRANVPDFGWKAITIRCCFPAEAAVAPPARTTAASTSAAAARTFVRMGRSFARGRTSTSGLVT
jgi:hypothetical protein